MSDFGVLSEEPLVSVVTPSFNQGRFIEDTIRSVRLQDYPRIEHWVIDGGSTDGTVEVLERVERETADDGSYELRWISEPDEGQGHAVNKGFERVGGRVVGWLNSDDMYFARGTIAAVVEAFRAEGKGLLYGDDVLVGPRNELLRVDRKPAFDRARLLRECFICQPALLFRSEVVREHRLRPDLDYAMDYEFWLRLSRRYAFGHIDLIVAADRNHGERKILRGRGGMVAEREALQRRYGLEWSVRHGVGWAADRATSAWNRLRGVRDVVQMPRRDDLAFDLRVDALPAAVGRQLLRRNRSLT